MEERRKEYVKIVKGDAEEGRISVRNVRRKAKEQLERIQKDGEAGEDEVKHALGVLDELTKKKVDEIDSLLAAKEKELLEV